MNPNPMVSIITPSYNQGEFIEETILSIKGQTFKDFEHMVVDAGSTDNTLDILRKYEGTYNLSWSSEPDEGMYQAINKGLQKARGEILCYLNTDDLYLPWTLEAVADYFTRHKDVDLLYGDIINLDDDKHTAELTFCPPFNLNWALVTGGLNQPSAFWSRRAYEKIGGFDENLQIAGDYEYWLRIAVQGTVKKLNEFLAVDRNYSKRKSLVQYNLALEELFKIREAYGAPPIAKSALRFFYRSYGYFWTRCYMALFISQYLRRGDRKLWPQSAKNLQLPSLSKLLIRFLPYAGKHRGPWRLGIKYRGNGPQLPILDRQSGDG